MNSAFSMEEARNISQNLRTLRCKILGISQKEFSDSVQLAQTSLSAFELGKRQILADAVNRICEVYDVRREWLLHNEIPVFASEESDQVLVDGADSIRLPVNKAKSLLLQALAQMVDSLPDDAVDKTIRNLVGILSQLEAVDNSNTAAKFSEIAENSDGLLEND